MEYKVLEEGLGMFDFYTPSTKQEKLSPGVGAEFNWVLASGIINNK